MVSAPFYHYAIKLHLDTTGREGKVKPMRDVVAWHDHGAPIVPNGANRKAIFGFIEPEPISWVENKEFPTIWNELIESRRENLTLLKLEIPPEEVFVLDYALVRRALPKPHFSGMLGFVYDDAKIAENYRAYWHSKIPFLDYNGSYSLPELISFAECPLERVCFLDDSQDLTLK